MSDAPICMCNVGTGPHIVICGKPRSERARHHMCEEHWQKWLVRQALEDLYETDEEDAA